MLGSNYFKGLKGAGMARGLLGRNGMKRNLIAVAVTGLLCAANAHAAFTFSDVSLTSNSVTFTINGDMTGYTAPATHDNQFGMQWTGSLFSGYTYEPNSWSSDVFDNKTFSDMGNTGLWDSAVPYSWSWQSSSLADAVATNRTVTMTTGAGFFNPSGTGTLNFTWGWANTLGDPTIIGSVDFRGTAPVPEPETYAMMLAGLGLLGVAARRRKQKAVA